MNVLRCPIIELRQYALHPGQREALITLFDREFVESQEVAGIRVIGQFRDLDDRNRFVIELTQAIDPARDAEGRIDIRGTMQVITTVIEGWVREHPEQWLWLHRRWR